MCCSDLSHSSMVYSSASVELRTVIDCLLDIQWRVPLSHIRKSEREWDLNNSSCYCWSHLGWDWWGAVCITQCCIISSWEGVFDEGLNFVYILKGEFDTLVFGPNEVWAYSADDT